MDTIITIAAILFGIVVVAFIGYLVWHRNANRRRSGRNANSAPAPTPAPPAPPANTGSGHGGGGGHGGGLIKWIVNIAIVLGILFALYLVITTVIAGWHSLLGPHSAQRQQTTSTGTASPSSVSAPATADTLTADSCANFSMDVQACVLNGTTRVMLAPGTAAGLHTCWGPKIDDPSSPYERVRIILENGSVTDFDPAHTSLPIIGYEFTPRQKGLVLRYWLTADQVCT